MCFANRFLRAACIIPHSPFNEGRLDNSFKESHAPKMLTVDFSTYNPIWGSTRTNKRGRQLAEFAVSNKRCALNDGNSNAFAGHVTAVAWTFRLFHDPCSRIHGDLQTWKMDGLILFRRTLQLCPFHATWTVTVLVILTGMLFVFPLRSN